MKRMNLSLDDSTYRNLKALAALKDLTIGELIKRFVNKEIEENPEECKLCLRYNQPNKETIKALNEKRGKTFNSAKELMKDLMSD